MPKTLRERYVLGLEALGFERDRGTRVTKYLVYHRPGAGFDKKLWFVGDRSLRVGSASTMSRKASSTTKEHVLTAPERRPAVFRAADALATFADFPDPVSLATELKERDAGMAAIPFRSLLAHSTAWLRARGVAVPKVTATPDQLRGAVAGQDAEDAP